MALRSLQLRQLMTMSVRQASTVQQWFSTWNIYMRFHSKQNNFQLPSIIKDIKLKFKNNLFFFEKMTKVTRSNRLAIASYNDISYSTTKRVKQISIVYLLCPKQCHQMSVEVPAFHRHPSHRSMQTKSKKQKINLKKRTKHNEIAAMCTWAEVACSLSAPCSLNSSRAPYLRISSS